jgi:hypothetical protein
MKAFKFLSCLVTATAISARVINEEAVTVTVTSCTEPTAAINILAASPSIFESNPTATIDTSRPAATLGPVTNPLCDTSDLDNIVLKKNLTLHYGSDDPTTPDSNAKITLQMKWPSVLLEEIAAVKDVICSNSGVIVTFADLAAFEMSAAKWPSSSEFLLITNHLGNCDAQFERGLFLVAGMTFDKSSLTVSCAAEKSDFESTAGK